MTGRRAMARPQPDSRRLQIGPGARRGRSGADVGAIVHVRGRRRDSRAALGIAVSFPSPEAGSLRKDLNPQAPLVTRTAKQQDRAGHGGCISRSCPPARTRACATPSWRKRRLRRRACMPSRHLDNRPVVGPAEVIGRPIWSAGEPLSSRARERCATLRCRACCRERDDSMPGGRC